VAKGALLVTQSGDFDDRRLTRLELLHAPLGVTARGRLLARFFGVLGLLTRIVIALALLALLRRLLGLD
jgi:hypothetical protein